MLGLCGAFGGFAHGLVEPGFLLPFGFGQVEHQVVEEVGVADEAGEFVVGFAGFFRELGSCCVGEVVGLGEAHLLFLLGWW